MRCLVFLCPKTGVAIDLWLPHSMQGPSLKKEMGSDSFRSLGRDWPARVGFGSLSLQACLYLPKPKGLRSYIPDTKYTSCINGFGCAARHNGNGTRWWSRRSSPPTHSLTHTCIGI